MHSHGEEMKRKQEMGETHNFPHPPWKRVWNNYCPQPHGKYTQSVPPAHCVYVNITPGNPTLWRRVPVAPIQKSVGSSGRDWKPGKKLQIPCEFCTYRFIRYSSTWYGKLHIDPLMANIRNPDFFTSPVVNATWFVVVLTCYLNRDLLTLNVRGSSYLSLTRSISWLLMPWLLTLPGHQQPWYWLYRMCRSLSYLRKDFKYLCQINVEEWHKMQINVYVPPEKFST